MVQYDSRFADAFWNSSKETLLRHLFNIMTSWALVVDVWYLPAQRRRVSLSFTVYVMFVFQKLPVQKVTINLTGFVVQWK